MVPFLFFFICEGLTVLGRALMNEAIHSVGKKEDGYLVADNDDEGGSSTGAKIVGMHRMQGRTAR
jgi:hypothetical protein